jgi:hypothetical protein
MRSWGSLIGVLFAESVIAYLDLCQMTAVESEPFFGLGVYGLRPCMSRRQPVHPTVHLYSLARVGG